VRCRGVLERNNDTHTYLHARKSWWPLKYLGTYTAPPGCLRKSVRPSVTGYVTNNREKLVEFTQNVSSRKIHGKPSVAVAIEIGQRELTLLHRGLCLFQLGSPVSAS
jgi:hypothetical protein